MIGTGGRSDVAETILLRVTDAIWRAHTDGLHETIRRQQQERLQHELTLAKRIQERLLPRTVPEIPGFDIAGKVLPAAEVGGDYWSCKSYPEDDIVTLKLADVTGHGVAAATLVAAVKFISGGYYRGSKSAAQVMERTNAVLVRETPHEVMVTMFYGWLYPESSEMTVVNAGHSPVLHYHRERFCHIPPTGPALGMIEARYREARLSLDPGDIFITCSDGVTEPSAEVALGVEWVEREVAQHAEEPAAVIVERILEGALRVYGTPRDDMSVVVVRRI
jgi:sigma-B regulation protein RsbU (phosphoserine phosphatase)